MSLGVAWVLSVRVGRVRIVWLGYTIGGGAACLTWITLWVKDICMPQTKGYDCLVIEPLERAGLMRKKSGFMTLSGVGLQKADTCIHQSLAE